MTKQFVASMSLFRIDGELHAFIRVTDEGGEEKEVVVPPHMAAMLPQAIAMLEASEDGE